MTEQPSPGQLWNQAGGDPERYRELMREHGHILSPGDDGYEEAARSALPCGWNPRVESALASLGKSPDRRQERRPECIHELDPATCSVCSGRDREPAPDLDPAKFGPWFAARYPGRCSACDRRTGEDDQIRADGDGGYLCAACGREDGRS